MRFRKARSFLSAYSNDELTGRREEQVREQLASNESLRREETTFKSIREAAKRLPEMKTSDDFNARLLNRIAHERFAETRTKAYFPRRKSVGLWGKLVPAVAAAAVMVLAAITVFQPTGQEAQPYSAQTGGSVDNAYLTVQPNDNPNLDRAFAHNVSLQDLIRKVDQAENISDFLTFGSGFRNVVETNTSGFHTASAVSRMPFTVHYYKVRPVYRGTLPVTSRKESQVY